MVQTRAIAGIVLCRACFCTISTRFGSFGQPSNSIVNLRSLVASPPATQLYMLHTHTGQISRSLHVIRPCLTTLVTARHLENSEYWAAGRGERGMNLFILDIHRHTGELPPHTLPNLNASCT